MARIIGEFVSSFDPATLTPALRDSAARTLFDTHAVAIGGLDEPAVLRALAYLEAVGAMGGASSLWGRLGSAGPEAAALINGIAAHVLDYDDVSSPMRGHPSVVLWPSLVALAEHRDLSAARMASAYVVGFEVLVKLSRAMAESHYALGWHSTPGLGTLGATAACAHLLALDSSAVASALGLAVAQTAGTRQNFGSDAKSLQAGHAAAAAVRAALLAEQGFTAGDAVIEGPGGFLALYGGRVEALGEQLHALGQAPLELLASGVEVKKYPMCYAAHRTLDGLLDLRAANGLTLDRVARVEVTSSRGGLLPLIHHRPVDGLQAKFSLEYAVAAALADGVVRLGSFDNDQVQRPQVQAFFERVTGAEVGQGLFPRFAQIAVTLKDGRSLQARVDALRGSTTFPLRDDELMDKARDCYSRQGVSIDVEGFFSAARRMQSFSVRQLMARARPFGG